METNGISATTHKLGSKAVMTQCKHIGELAYIVIFVDAPQGRYFEKERNWT